MILNDKRRWAMMRRLQYGVGYLTTLTLVFVGGYFLFFYAPPTCFDTVQNGDELAVDCGGTCTRICAISVTPPAILWAKSFPASPGQWNAVAYIENSNPVAGTASLAYTFTLEDASGIIATRSGITVLPPNSTYPVFEGRIDTQGRTPITTRLTIDGESVWVPATVGREQFKTASFDLEGVEDRPRLNARLENTELTAAKDVEIVATIFDASGNPLTASQTFVADFAPRTTKDVIFTWPRPIAKTIRSCAVPTDVVIAIDLSGSMNNDGSEPPQPVTAVLNAASSFVSELTAADQVSVVTFASVATVNQLLTTNSEAAAQLVRGLTIDPAEETGTTNTAAGLEAAKKELTSPRHNVTASRVAIILTDGLATAPQPNPDAAATSAAATLKSQNVSLFTIGLGKAVNMDLLRTLASTPEQAYAAPTTATLGNIYKTITDAICEDGAARIDIIPKTGTNFAPLTP